MAALLSERSHETKIVNGLWKNKAGVKKNLRAEDENKSSFLYCRIRQWASQSEDVLRPGI